MNPADVNISLIVAADENDVIGKEGHLPWHLTDDLKRFRSLTTGHVVVAGRVTQDSIVERLGGPLPDRTTIVVTRQDPDREGKPNNVHYAHSIGDAIRLAKDLAAANEGREVFVIGGAQIYLEALDQVQTVYLTRVHDTVPGDREMARGWLNGFGEAVEKDEREGFTFEKYERQ